MHKINWHWRRNNFRELSNLWQTRLRLQYLWFQLSWHLRNRPIAMSNRVRYSFSGVHKLMLERQRSQPIRAPSSEGIIMVNCDWMGLKFNFRCKSGFIQNKNEKQSWVKCKCKRDGNCHFRRIENIHCKINDNLLSRKFFLIIWPQWPLFDLWWSSGIEIKPNMSINDTVSNLNPDRQTKVIIQMRALIQNFEDENPDWETVDDEENIEGNDKMTYHVLYLTPFGQGDGQFYRIL